MVNVSLKKTEIANIMMMIGYLNEKRIIDSVTDLSYTESIILKNKLYKALERG